MTADRTPKHIKLDERHHVVLPLLDQLVGLSNDTRTLIQR
jgi:hypothetical protein